MRDLMLVLNFDDAASRAVTRKMRAEKIFCKIVPGNLPLEGVLAQDPRGLVLSGGATGDPSSGLDERILLSGIPTLALGDAAALLLQALGGEPGEKALFGAVMNLRYEENVLTQGIENGERLLQCARAFQLPSALTPVCRAEELVIGFAHETLPLYGFQIQTEQNDLEGSMLLRNFALSVCGCTAWWDDGAFVSRAVEEIGRTVGGGRAVCVTTGGIDSGVSALLAFKALGSRLKCVFVDAGLLCDRESEEFLRYYRDEIGMDILRIPAEDGFLKALQGASDPEEKRRAINGRMREILREAFGQVGAFDAVIRGTCYNDIMFGPGKRRLMPEEAVQEIYPVQELFKDEIRRVGEYMGIPQELLSRPSFPGSSLALRVLGEATADKLRVLRAAEAIFRSEVCRSGANKRLWQYFAVLASMPGEKDAHVICLRAVHASERGMAYAARLPYDVTENAADRILRECPQVRRVLYDLTPSSHYSGIEWQ